MNPGDTSRARLGASGPCALNEGRGVNPGDTSTATAPSPGPRRSLNEGRGVNPGDTHRPRDRPARTDSTALNEGRGVNPGDTLAHARHRARGHDPLNEGRGVNPGDTHHPWAGPGAGAARSTKAGA